MGGRFSAFRKPENNVPMNIPLDPGSSSRHSMDGFSPFNKPEGHVSMIESSTLEPGSSSMHEISGRFSSLFIRENVVSMNMTPTAAPSSSTMHNMHYRRLSSLTMPQTMSSHVMAPTAKSNLQTSASLPQSNVPLIRFSMAAPGRSIIHDIDFGRSAALSLPHAPTRDPILAVRGRARMSNFCAKKGIVVDRVMICASCQTTVTPQWRRGPEGVKSLCNACGIRFSKQRKASGIPGSRSRKKDVVTKKRKSGKKNKV